MNGDGFADVIVGAPSYDAGQTDEGAAFVFLGSASGIADGGPAAAATQLESNQANANLGWSVAGAGDVNGDGYADVIVGRVALRQRPDRRGRRVRVPGQRGGRRRRQSRDADVAQLEANQVSAQLGWSVAGAGDVNGDGYADVIVGAPLYDAGQTDEGAAFVFLGSASGIADGNPSSAGTRSSKRTRSARRSGCSVASAGDVNGDGYADVIVGAYLYDDGPGRRGRGVRVPRQRDGHRGRQSRDGAPRSSSRTRRTRNSAGASRARAT